MSHFSKKNIGGIFGAGGGQKSPAPPSPPTLKPPKLGDLQAISSYDYSESIDLVSDGEIDGLVSPNGEYVDGVRLFESIYLEDVVVRQAIDDNSSDVAAEYDLSFIGQAFNQKFYSNGSFIETSVNDVSDFSAQNSGISCSILTSKDSIAESIFNTISLINAEYNAISSNTSSAFFKQLRLLRSQFNFSSQREVLAYLLPDFPDNFSSDYPFVAVKIDLNIDLGSAYGYAIDDLIQFNSDIYNQIYIDFEPEEIQNKKILGSKKMINLSFFGVQPSLKGSFYLFIYQKNGFILKNGIDAIINHVKNIKVLKTFSKFNYANATFEVRNGESLQKPLSLFNKTYLNFDFNAKLRGPFQKEKPVLTLLNGEFNTAQTKFDANSPSAIFGTISSFDSLISSSYITASQYNDYKNRHSFLFSGTELINNALSLLNNSFQNYRLYSFSKNGSILTLIVYNIQTGSVNYVAVSFDTSTGYFQSIARYNNSATFGNLNIEVKFLETDTQNIQSQDQFIGDPNNGVKPTYTTTYPFYLFLPVMCRALLEYAFSNEGSQDIRKISNGTDNYSSWNNDYIKYMNEPAQKFTHVVLNPNVDSAFMTLNITYLMDTAIQQTTLLKQDGQDQSVEAGINIPSIIEFIVETGYQNLDGTEEIYLQRTYQVRGLINSPVFIDIGREENESVIQQYSRFILGSENVAKPISLPSHQANKNRFIRVYRSTAESYSSLIRREIYLQKITEIINVPFSYPYSTICGLKLDARTLQNIPSRSYDARFKKVFVPSNYFPLKPNGQDKRYILGKDLAEFNSLSNSSDEKSIYKGNWDGTFKLAWTDNPVWVLFDILINRRYGLGNFISPSEVNYWELYKIGRYCDAVDSNGLFVGVPAADGGLEPRYAFNGVIADKTNVFESLKSLVACFRGNMFYTNSEINFTNDRLKPIMAFFNNSNVKDGMFNYSNERRDLQYNVIEVTYLDRDDLFKQKIEYVEDPDDIKTRGILRTTAQTFGITSRAHAKRLGQHIIYSTINEDENVAFVGGLETLLCRPGDLIAINDNVKTLKNHVGRVLDVDPINNSIYTNVSLKSSDFSSSGLTGEISVLIPTGKYQSSDFYNLAKSPSKLSVSEIYQTDVPVRVTFQTTGTQLMNSSPALDYGSKFFIDTGCSGYPLLQQVRAGTPCSITIANTKQQVYKIQSIKELNLNEYEVVASKFDTGKFAEIEQGETGLMQDFFSAFPAARNTSVSEGQAELLQNKYKYDLGFPTITAFSTGNWDLQSDAADLSGRWTSVPNANCYNVELITPKFKSIKQTVTGTSAIFEDQVEVGRFTLKVTARNTGSYPNPISATASRTATILSYTAPVRNNGIIQGFVINR